MEFFDSFDPQRTAGALALVACLALGPLYGTWYCLDRIAKVLEERNKQRP